MTILPQTFATQEDRPIVRFMCERASLKYCERGVLAADLALGLDYETNTRPRRRARGVSA